MTYDVARRVTLVALLMACAACSEGAVQPDTRLPDRVLFVRDRVLLVVNPDGTNEQQFSPDARRYAHPRLAPDGQSIFVSAERSLRCGEIVQLALDGSPMRTLDAGSWCATSQQVSPDMQRVVFLAEQASVLPPEPFVATMRLDGTEFVNLSAMLPPPVGCPPSTNSAVRPSVVGWLSETRVQIKRFASCEADRSFTINSNGGDVIEQDMGHPSPDGTRALKGGTEMVIRNRLSGARSIVSRAASFVPDVSVFSFSPWSSDQTHVVYRHFADGNVYIGKADGSGEVRVPLEGNLWGFAGANDRLLYTTATVVDGVTVRNLFLVINDGSAPVPLSVGKGPVSEALFLEGR